MDDRWDGKSQKTKPAGPCHGGAPATDPQLGEDLAGVPADGIDGEGELVADRKAEG
jgi:hypothetical protein